MQYSKNQGYFRLFQSKEDEKFYVTYVASNHEPILQGSGHATKCDAEARIADIRVAAPCAANYERFNAQDGKPMFRLVNSDGIKLGRSETYESTAARDNGIVACQKYICDAYVIDKTDPKRDTYREAKLVAAAESAGSLVIRPKHRRNECDDLPVKPKPGGVYGDS